MIHPESTSDRSMTDLYNTPSIRNIPGLGIDPSSEFTQEALLKMIEEWLAASLVNSLSLAVIRVDDERFMGQVDFGKLDLAAKTAVVGIVLRDDDETRGKGYAVEALTALFDYGFNKLSLETITLGTAEGNVPMRGLLEKKFGLVGKLEPLAEGAETANRGDFDYVLSSTDWPQSRAKAWDIRVDR